MGMNLNQLWNAFKVENSKKLDHKALGFHSFKQLLTSLQFLGIMDIEHSNNNVVIMYPTMKNVAITRNWKKWVPIWRHNLWKLKTMCSQQPSLISHMCPHLAWAIHSTTLRIRKRISNFNMCFLCQALKILVLLHLIQELR